MSQFTKALFASLIVAGLTAVAAPAAYAQSSVAKELFGFREISVRLAPGAKECNLQDAAEEFQKRVQDGLFKSGVVKNDESVLTLALTVRNRKFGVLGVQCALFTQLAFYTHLPSENIKTTNERRRKIIDRIGALPLVIWEHNSFAVAALTGNTDEEVERAGIEKVNQMIDLILKRFAEQRSE